MKAYLHSWTWKPLFILLKFGHVLGKKNTLNQIKFHFFYIQKVTDRSLFNPGWNCVPLDGVKRKYFGAAFIWKTSCLHGKPLVIPLMHFDGSILPLPFVFIHLSSRSPALCSWPCLDGAFPTLFLGLSACLQALITTALLLNKDLQLA